MALRACADVRVEKKADEFLCGNALRCVAVAPASTESDDESTGNKNKS